jgi:LEA14-like dessication related protein
MKIFAVAAALLLLSCGKVAEPEFRSIENFGLKKLGFTETIIGFDVVYFNPNKFGVSVKETDLDVYIDSVLVGKFNQVNEIKVGANEDFRIPLQGSVSIEKALDLNIQDMIGKEVLISAEGDTRIGRSGVFITKEIRYSGKHKINADILKNPAGAGF